jgi:hypothetical protein
MMQVTKIDEAMWGVMFPSMNAVGDSLQREDKDPKPKVSEALANISEDSPQASQDISEQLDLEKKALQTVKQAYDPKPNGKKRRESVVARAMNLEKVNSLYPPTSTHELNRLVTIVILCADCESHRRSNSRPRKNSPPLRKSADRGGTVLIISIDIRYLFTSSPFLPLLSKSKSWRQKSKRCRLRCNNKRNGMRT